MKSLRVAFTTFVLVLTVYADGPFCTQSGLGPADMMMSNGNMNPKYMWEKSGGKVRIPVVLDHAYNHKERDIIFGGLAEMASKTCVKFLIYKHPEEVHDGDHVYITKTKGKGCWSYVGKQGGSQDLSLPVRADRDKFVHIIWENIQRGRERNFEKKRDSKSDNYGPYDYESIMHYDNRAFSRNGHDTIRPTQGFVRIGRGKRMSHWDAKKINLAYKCHGGGKGGGFGYNDGLSDFEYDDNQNSPLIGFAPDHSFRTQNPFLSGAHPNEVDHEEVDFSPFSGPIPPYYMVHSNGDDDYYHP
ncbi:Zinc metalloproteinase nas-14 [Folsomia candida]|uniref:Metalloendopeptidase n=1 Tax=Folsomia candida TaxID=158441 RepID=A0A226EMY1_FOLCA|nr:Zinc metalloproteinase nas-14 [Folsomia candida]